jgi:hypothetical protein
MSEILSRVWTVSHRVEIWLLILVAYLLQRNVNSGHLPTKAADPEAFMNVVSWGFPCFGEVRAVLTFAFVKWLHAVFYILRCFMLEHARIVWCQQQHTGGKLNWLSVDFGGGLGGPPQSNSVVLGEWLNLFRLQEQFNSSLNLQTRKYLKALGPVINPDDFHFVFFIFLLCSLW